VFCLFFFTHAHFVIGLWALKFAQINNCIEMNDDDDDDDDTCVVLMELLTTA
jgi:hypothetical protein